MKRKASNLITTWIVSILSIVVIYQAASSPLPTTAAVQTNLHNKILKGHIMIYNIISDESSDIYSLDRKGANLLRAGKDNEAMPFFEKVLAIDSNNSVALRGKAVAFVDFGKYNEAIPLLDKALAIDPTDITILDFKAANLAMLGKYNDAIAVYDKALAIDPNDKVALDGKAAVIDALKVMK